jgi:hypothetical protein
MYYWYGNIQRKTVARNLPLFSFSYHSLPTIFICEKHRMPSNKQNECHNLIVTGKSYIYMSLTAGRCFAIPILGICKLEACSLYLVYFSYKKLPYKTNEGYNSDQG